MSELKLNSEDNSSVPGKDGASERAPKLFKEASPKHDRESAGYGYQRIRLHKKDEVNPYADELDERYGMDARTKKLVVMSIILVVVYLLACVLPTNVFDATRSDRTIGTLANETATSIASFIGFFTNPDTMFGAYMLTVLVSIFAGIAMAVSGGVFQGSMKNALAAPSTLGVMQGGTVGAIIFSVFFYSNSLTFTYQGTVSGYEQAMAALPWWRQVLESYGTFFCSLLGCIIVVALVMAIAMAAGRGKVNNVSLVVAGQVFASSITIVLGFARTWFYNHGDVTVSNYLAQATTTTFAGSYTVFSVALFVIPVLACLAFIFAKASKLSLLSLNDDEARSMGIATTRLRIAMVAVCTVLTALVVAFCGPVGFVGFLIPHMARRVVGPDFRYLLPACGIMGGILVGAVFYLANLGIPYLSTASVGVFTSLIGCIAFLVIALRGRRSSGGEWL